jgi:hypothetical protein
MKWQYLLKRSTTIRITDLPPTRAKALMKSMPMSVHMAYGMGRGSSSLAGWRCSDLLCWEVEVLHYPAHGGEVEVTA